MFRREIKGLVPLSVNKAWRGGPRFRTDDYKKYAEDLGKLLGACEKVEGRVSVRFDFYLPKRSFGQSDVDNLLKPLLDILVKCGVIEDDRWVIRLEARKIESDDYRVKIFIREGTVEDEDDN